MNPYRNLKVCPLDRNKIERLKASFEENDFWDNLLARPSKIDPTLYEIAYGAHRLAALSESGWEEVDIAVKDLSDESMIKIMGTENREWYGSNTNAIVETVRAAKEFIEAEITAKESNFNDLDKWCQELFKGEEGFKNSILSHPTVQHNGRVNVGRAVIMRFLGDSWGVQSIRLALSIIHGESTVNQINLNPTTLEEDVVQVNVVVSGEAVTKFEDIGHARSYIDTITRSPECRAAYPTEEAQVRVASEIIGENAKLTSKVIHENLLKKSHEILNSSERLFETKIGHKSQAIATEINKLHKRFLDLPDFTKQRVLTKNMVQASLNDIYNFEYLLNRYRKNMEAHFKMAPDTNSIAYDYFPTCFDYTQMSSTVKTEESVKVPNDQDFFGRLAEDDEVWLDGWLGDNRAVVEEEMGGGVG